eukprot:c43082_g1_i1 orf=254-1912(+)
MSALAGCGNNFKLTQKSSRTKLEMHLCAMSFVSLGILSLPATGAVSMVTSNLYASIPSAGGLENNLHDQEKGGSLRLNFSVVVIIALLTVAFVLSGCLHLVARCLSRRQNADTESIMTMGSVRGPLHQLFHVHDWGVDQATIDALPTFSYVSIIKGVEGSNDCAVCLCEFQPKDRLRLLPQCSHAFHMECIDTWLLSHSTCPLCRRSILSDGFHTPQSLRIAGDSYRSGLDLTEGMNIFTDSEDRIPGDSLGHASLRTSHGSEDSFHVHGRGSWEQCGCGFSQRASPQDSQLQLSSQSAASNQKHAEESKDSNGIGRVVSVQLGKFRSSNSEAGATGNSGNTEARTRSYSMGSYEYVLNSDNLHVILSPTHLSGLHQKRQFHRPAFSESTSGFKYDGIKTSCDFDATWTGESSWVNLSLEEKGMPASSPDAKEFSIEMPAFLDTMKERLLGRKWPLSARKSPVSDRTASHSTRAFSFRVPIPEWKQHKASQNRRSLSETTGLDSLSCIWVPAAGGSTSSGAHHQGQNGEAQQHGSGRLPSFRKWALQWLMRG